MKLFTTVLVAIVLLLISIGTSHADNKRLNGLLIGAGSGAVISQISGGRDTKSVLVATAIGGALGYAIGSQVDERDNRYSTRFKPRQSVVHYDRNRRWPDYQRRGFQPRYFNERSHNTYRFRGNDCSKTVKYVRKKGKVSKIVKTTCKEPRKKYRWKRSPRW